MLTTPELYALLDAEHAIAATHEVDAALAAIAGHAMRLTSAVGAVIELAEAEEMVYQAVAGTLAPYLGLRLRRGRSLSGLCIERDEPLRSDDVELDARVDRMACQRLGIASMICVPLGARVPGVLKVCADRTAAFGDTHEEILRILARSAVIALDRARRSRVPVTPLVGLAGPALVDRAMYETIVASMADAVLVVDTQARVLLQNDAMRELLGENHQQPFNQRALTPEGRDLELSERPTIRSLAGETIRQHEVAVPRANGEVRWMSVNSSPVRDASGAIRGAITVARDVTELHRARHALENAATHDELTGLFNRRGFLQHAEAALRRADRSGHGLALFYTDLNGMKAINDVHGHAEGDRALREFADALRGEFRGTDLAARLGGDEFVLLALDCDTDLAVRAAAERLQERLRERNRIVGRTFQLSASIGAVRYEPTVRQRSIDDLISEADDRMYRAKQHRKRAGTQPLERFVLGAC